MQRHCRDNVTMFSDHKVVGYCIITLVVVATPFKHRDLHIVLPFFMSPKLYCTVLRCRVVVVAKLTKFPVPSSSYSIILGKKSSFYFLKNVIFAIDAPCSLVFSETAEFET